MSALKLLIVGFLAHALAAPLSSTSKKCTPGNFTLDLNTYDDGAYGSAHNGQAIPNGYRGLTWINFYDSAEGPTPPTGTFSFAQISGYSAGFFVNTTTHPTVAALTLESFSAGCTYLLDGKYLQGAACQYTVSAIKNAPVPDGSIGEMIKTQVFNATVGTADSGFTSHTAKPGLTGTHFYFYLTGGFPGTTFFLDDIVLKKACTS